MHHKKDSELVWKVSAALMSTFNMLGLFDKVDISIMYGFISNNVKYADISVPIIILIILIMYARQNVVWKCCIFQNKPPVWFNTLRGRKKAPLFWSQGSKCLKYVNNFEWLTFAWKLLRSVSLINGFVKKKNNWKTVSVFGRRQNLIATFKAQCLKICVSMATK